MKQVTVREKRQREKRRRSKGPGVEGGKLFKLHYSLII